jgi:hypothetical protein
MGPKPRSEGQGVRGFQDATPATPRKASARGKPAGNPSRDPAQPPERVSDPTFRRDSGQRPCFPSRAMLGVHRFGTPGARGIHARPPSRSGGRGDLGGGRRWGVDRLEGGPTEVRLRLGPPVRQQLVRLLDGVGRPAGTLLRSPPPAGALGLPSGLVSLLVPPIQPPFVEAHGRVRLFPRILVGEGAVNVVAQRNLSTI